MCEDFSCPRNVRRPPTSSEAGTDVALMRQPIVQDRIAGLQERVTRFVQKVEATR